jgi:hypothetical protein
MFLAKQRFITEISPQPSAIPGGNPPEDWQSAVGWGDTRIKPGTTGQQSGVLLLSHHASHPSLRNLLFFKHFWH